MLVLFFTIIFIAELIIAGWLVSGITSLNKKVCATNQEVIEFQPQIKTCLKNAKEEIKKVSRSLECFTDFVAKKQTDCKESFKKNLPSKIILSILKIPAKRLITIIELVLAIKKFLK